ncbi:MAG: Pr6Pr family membrane protein [Dietzia sp.]|nr:Pr6Pr family membrane protein [Dietzia sp.]
MDYVAALFRIGVAVLALAATKEVWLDLQPHEITRFTNQANLMLAVVMIWAALASLGLFRQPPAWFKVGVLMLLSVTGLVVFFILGPESPDAPVRFLGLTQGTIEHQITPVLALVDFLVLDQHRRLRWSAPVIWLGYMLAYVAFALIRAELIAVPHYEYSFINLVDLGWGGLARNVVGLSVGFAVLGLVYVAIDRALPAHPLLGSGGQERPHHIPRPHLHRPVAAH